MPDAPQDGNAPQLASIIESLREQERASRAAFERLGALAESVDSRIREELRAAFVEEFQALGSAALRAEEALQRVRRVASVRMAAWALGVTIGCAGLSIAVAWVVLPSRAQLAQLRGERDALLAGVEQLEGRGGKIDLRRCGAARRLCVRIERTAPAFGEHADYLIVKGY